MPDIRTVGLDVNPSAEPLLYPGQPVTDSSLVVGPWIYRIEPMTGSCVSDWFVGADGGPLGADVIRLDTALSRLNAAPMNDRYPLLAVGSNASPGQLRHKFSAGSGVSNVIPITRATVNNICVGHSAHVSAAGYIPYIPLACISAGGTRRTLFVLWLDDRQVSRMDKTEPNYEPTSVSGVEFPALLDSGEGLREYSLYRGRWGALRLIPNAQPIRATTQRELFGLLCKQPWFMQLVPLSSEGPDAIVRAFSVDQRLREQVRETMASTGLAADDRLGRSG